MEGRTMYELKACPFCGGKVNLTYYSAENEYRIWHNWDNTKECFLQEPIRLDGERIKSLGEAAEAWNRRAGR
ncbi:MAG: hypothetical protein IKU94_01450 [Bacteroidaceae bacterium]|nr:hypothetical protein [Bacteroidaceae bacterium]